VFAPLAQDVNGDGLTDLVVPGGETLDVWIQQAATEAAGGPAFARAARVRVRVAASADTDTARFSDTLEASVTIPGLRLADVNGDGRPDLLVEDGELRAFHLVRADGSIPREPDVSVDLGIFRDTTPQATLTPGRTLAGQDRTVYESRDLDEDGVPDYVIAHRRKVWVFHGTRSGPQFTEPTTILKAADDVTAVLVVDLDDGRPDLLLIKVQVPSVAAILRGLVAEWTIDVAAIGYRNAGERTFETSPRWRSTLTFRAPAILSVLKDPEKIVRRFEGAGKKFRTPCEGDFDGDGVADLGLVSADGTALELWRGDAGRPAADSEPHDAVLRRILFEDEDRTWDLDRVLELIGGFGDRRLRVLTGGRASDARLALRDQAEWRLASLAPADVDGDGRTEVVLRYEAVAGGGSVFDVMGWRCSRAAVRGQRLAAGGWRRSRERAGARHARGFARFAGEGDAGASPFTGAWV
jgi:hypothetical protein